MKKIGYVLFFAAVCLLFAVFYRHQFHASLQHGVKNTLIVGTNASFPPFEYVINGKLEGFEIELMKELGKYLSKEIVFKDMAFESLLMEAQLGRIDLIAAAMTLTPERSKQMFFTKPYLEHDSLVVITLVATPVENIADLQGKEVVVNEGYTAETFMNQQKGVILHSLATPAEAFFALMNGQCYAYVSARSAVQPFFDRYGIKQFHVLALNAADSYALAMPKSSPQLFEEVEHALRALEVSGVITRLKERWHLNF